MHAPIWGTWADTEFLPTRSSHSEYHRTAVSTKYLVIAAVVSKGDFLLTICFGLGHIWDLEGEGVQRERARSKQGWAFCLAAEDSVETGSFPAIERDAELLEERLL